MASLPSGTVTFLLTDIEGSTQLWDAFPDDMRVAVGLHDTLIAEAVVRHGGGVVKNTGDGLFAAFDVADGAVGAAVAAQPCDGRHRLALRGRNTRSSDGAAYRGDPTERG